MGTLLNTYLANASPKAAAWFVYRDGFCMHVMFFVYIYEVSDTAYILALVRELKDLDSLPQKSYNVIKRLSGWQNCSFPTPTLIKKLSGMRAHPTLIVSACFVNIMSWQNLHTQATKLLVLWSTNSSTIIVSARTEFNRITHMLLFFQISTMTCNTIHFRYLHVTLNDRS